MCKKDICDTPVDEDVRTSPSPTPAGSEMWSLITSQPSSPPTRSSQMQEEDLQQYSIHLNRGNARPHAESNPVTWWHNHQQQFPILASSALEYFAAPCTSVDSERLFSTAGIIFGNKRRQRLLGKTARLFLMINANTNKDTSRACKAWSQREVERYGCHGSSNPPSTSSEQSSSEDSEEFSEESVEF
ncbi:unnamed protein product [Cylicocyclus nassatus]|uniref:HAT C-terminal dimerisation domain-containing protein n=1 Tax=Cylicocyclus nassatus TaxID=53992 RepID=A0AA36DKT3_CYLNA|nr:unnamed protein product [Cylicocyclus nassatus]